MKITKLTFLACWMAMTISASSLAETITSWTFETSTPNSLGPHAAEVGTGSARANNAGGAFYSNQVGNGSPESFESTGWGLADFLQFNYFEFRTSTVGYRRLSFSIDHTSNLTSNSAGPRDFKFSVSTNGSTFTDIGTYSALANSAPNAWSSGTYLPIHTYTTALPASLDNKSAIIVRVVQNSIISTNGGPVTTGAFAGRIRVDNVTISGELLPEPGTMALALAGIGAMLFHRK